MRHTFAYSLSVAILVGGLSACSTTTSVGELNYAIMNDSLTAVQDGIENGANVNGTVGEKNTTPMHTAALQGNIAIVTALVNAGAEVDIADCAGMTPLYYSARSGSVAVSRYLIEQGANVNRQISDSNITCNDQAPDGSPLSAAAASNKPDIVRLLLDNGATAGGQRAFAIALADPSREPVVKLLKSAGYEANEETARIIASLASPTNANTSTQTDQNVASNNSNSDASAADDVAGVAADVGGALILQSILGSVF